VSDDWLSDDPFVDPDDPAAIERARRRREREEKRRKRGGKEEAAEQKAPPSAPTPPAEPPSAPRTPEQEFWNEDPDPEEAPSHPEASPSPEPSPPPASPRGEQSTVTAAAPAATEPAPPAYHDEGDPKMTGAARRGRRSGDSGGGRGGFLGALSRHPFRIAAVVLAVIVLWFLNALFQPSHGDGSGRVEVTIAKGSSVSEVGDLLERKGVIDGAGPISGSTLFQARVTLAGKRSEIYSGHFTLAHGMSYGAAIDALSQPPVKRTTTVTIPEGYTRSQAAQLVEEDGVPGSYTKATVQSKYLNPAKYGGKGARNLEGFLFPDTFELKPNAPVGDLVQLQLQDFQRRIKKVNMAYAKSKNLTVFDVLIIASMVEREAGVKSQYKDVASVIYNRLHEGMPLGIDATIRFATGNYTKPLTESELAIESPYNTRANAGLPPGPIDSPGLAAIEAAAHPAKTGYIFYVTTPGACGKLTFAKTEAEFEAAVAKYDKAREEAGGNSPDSCGE
jgi:uncharacterized YceG family protein